MTRESRLCVGWLPVLTIAAIFPTAWLAATASAEERKIVVLLANVPKERQSNAPLPNTNDIWDQYFDKTKNSGPTRVDSFAEWWEEVSYGDVTVSGNVFGWVNLPWATVPPGGQQGGGLVPIGRIPHIELRGNNTFEPGQGEFFNNASVRFPYDLDGAGGNGNFGNDAYNAGKNMMFQPAGAGFTDTLGDPLFCPGERFLDLNGNGIYDAGFFEIGIDKNGNGMIDFDMRAESWEELFAATVTIPEDQEMPITFGGWMNMTEWYDGNGDGRWNVDRIFNNEDVQMPWVSQFTGLFAGITNSQVFLGDWGAPEIWIDRNQNGQQGERARQLMRVRGDMANQDQPADLWEFLIQINDPMSPNVKWFDAQWNNVHDFPEPFEDYLRRWAALPEPPDPMDPPGSGGPAFGFGWITVTEAYIRANFPGSEETQNRLLLRIGNGRYNGPDAWVNSRSQVESSNKAQIIYNELAGVEAAEFNRRSSFTTPPPAEYGGSWSLEDFWQDWYGAAPPEWDARIPYIRTFNPNDYRPLRPGEQQADVNPTLFTPDRGGPRNDGRDYDGTRFQVTGPTDGRLKPNPSDGREGLYDGPAEYEDLPSSIYHAAGDGTLGEVTSPLNFDHFGQDLGNHDPSDGGGFGDNLIPAASPHAFNVHGDSGYDAGNVLNLELLTVSTRGTHNTDRQILDPLTGDPVQIIYHRDINLDGLIDLGETIGDPGSFGLPPGAPGGPPAYHNYGTTPDPGRPANGNPTNRYPFNRQRAIEDVVAALDDVVDWDDFLGGPGPFGNRIMGLILLPPDTGPGGMFTLPASVASGYPIRTRDKRNPAFQGTLAFYQPLPFFDGMGITIGGAGEGGGLEADNTFQTSFAAHEYGHIWEGWPDLYDYDVRAQFPVNIVNNPIGRWCVMANGGLVHPVPVLKADSNWISVNDITRAVIPGVVTTVNFPAWEFNRDKTVFRFENPLFPGEEYWFWRTAAAPGGVLSFDRFLPGNGLMIMRVDRISNDEGLPPQQRIAAGRFTYQIIQADGDQFLENGFNTGDAGDPWPGTSNARKWDSTTDPDNRWHNGQPSGIDIVDIRPTGSSTDVDFLWSPRELPTFAWRTPAPCGAQDPSGTSVNGMYSLRYRAFDQFGGTQLEFYAVRNGNCTAPNYTVATQIGQSTKPPGEIDGVSQVNVAALPDGAYTLFARLVPGVGSDSRVESKFSLPRADIDNIGDGTLTVLNTDSSIVRFERWDVVCISATPAGSETWRVTGSSSGEQTARARTGVNYASDADSLGRRALQFRINAGPTRSFRVGDAFVFLTTGLTPMSTAILISDGEVVLPEPPDAVARVDGAITTGLAPLAVVFRHDESSDPHDAALSFRWNFGDNTPAFTTTDLNRAVTHTYENSGTYTATLTVTNAFGLSDTATLQIRVDEALTPIVRATAVPTSGGAPLRVAFDASQSTDPNPDTERLDFVWSFGDGSAPLTGARVEHVYDRSGIFIATVSVTNRPYNKTSTRNIEIRVSGGAADNLPPTAAIDVDRTLGTAPLTVQFDGGRSSDPEDGTLSFAWDFGDGSAVVRGASAVEHVFTRVGTFNVTLTVTDTIGQRDDSVIAISVIGDPSLNNQAPVARIVASTRQGPAPLTIRFDASASRDPENAALSYAWDFGDGSAQAAGMIVDHTYTTPREYNVVLQVRDPQGSLGAATIRVTVTSAAGSDDDGSDGESPIVGPGCGPGCGPIGLMPMLLTLIGIGGLRRLQHRRWRSS